MRSRSASLVWLQAVENLIRNGERVAPRGIPTRELLHQTFRVSMHQPVVRCPGRRLNHRFMAAEAYWILIGDDTVAGIAPYNSHIAEFSDDGLKFMGAYGPRIKEQLGWVCEKIVQDLNTRQAGLVIWRDKPLPSKDIPCTVAVWFSVRDGILNTHVFMRSSDVWLGLPYDIFNFCMLGWLVTAKVNHLLSGSNRITPGDLYLTAVSSHLYDKNYDAGCSILQESFPLEEQSDVPIHLQDQPDELIQILKECRENSKLGWWNAKEGER